MGAGQKKPDLLDVSMELKMTARQMERQSQKIEQSEKAERKKIVDVSPASLSILRICSP
jgi:hypothetical protein